MPYEVKKLLHHVTPAGIQPASLQLRYPRFIHAEVMTHRQFSRNASSSRAKPTKAFIQEARDNPAMPIFWGKNVPGMQAPEELTGHDKARAIAEWLAAAEDAADYAERMLGLGLHKQIANRILEPFTHIDVVVTSTEWANFRALRCHKDAMPEMRHLADLMMEALDATPPEPLAHGQWHLPYIDASDIELVEKHFGAGANDGEKGIALLQISVARCARVSYKVFNEDRKPTVAEDLALFERLAGSFPLHASPLEHQCTPDRAMVLTPRSDIVWENPHLHGNLHGMIQYRKTIANECVW